VADVERARALLARLEAATGHALATVDSDQLALTAAGRLLGAHAHAISATLDAARDHVSAVADGIRGALRVGVGVGVSWSLVGDVVAELDRAMPGLTTTPLRERDATALAAGEVDALLSYDGGDASCVLLDDPWVVLVASSSPLAGGAAAVAPDALAGVPLIAPRSPAARAVVAGALEAIGVAPSFAATVDDAPAVHALVAAGVGGGGSVLPRSAVDPWHPGTVVLGLDHLLAPRTLRLSWRDVTPALAALRRAAETTCARVTARRGRLGSLIDHR
jgi:DNA-binding transcriptional LysR family regulator